MNADEFTSAPGSDGTRFGRGFHRSNIATHEDRDVAIEEIFFPNQNDVGRFYHRVVGLDSPYKRASLSCFQEFLYRPYMICDPALHCWRDLQRPMNPAEIVEREMQRQCCFRLRHFLENAFVNRVSLRIIIRSVKFYRSTKMCWAVGLIAFAFFAFVLWAILN